MKTPTRCQLPSQTRSEDDVRQCFLALLQTSPTKEEGPHPGTVGNTKTKAALRKKRQPAHPTSLEIEKRFKVRSTVLRNACKTHRNSTMFRRIRESAVRLLPVWPVHNASLRYCPIQKTGSTTWTALLRTVWKEMKLKASRNRTPKSKKASYARALAANGTSFVFVREPYTRLLSAYVDKLFCPNTVFWRKVGKYIVKTFRENPSKSSLRCGHDVTFEEFISYVIDSQETGVHRDGHFVPIHDHCNFCNVNYDYIGHLETISEDMPYLLNVIQSPVNYSRNFEIQTLKSSVHWVLKSMKLDIVDCMPLEEAGRRLWKKLTIRGVIPKSQPFPFSSKEAGKVTEEEFVEAGLAAIARSGSWQTKRMQETEALREAFSTIPMQQRLKLKEALFLDFKLFGFDPEPETVFPKTPFVKQRGFSYFEL